MLKRSLAYSIFSLASFTLSASLSAAETDLKIVTSIKPVHSLVSNVMAGVGTPTLIVEGAASPHGYALKPSQAQLLQDANVIFWIGHSLETFLEKPIEEIAKNASVVEFQELEGLAEIESHHDNHEKHDEKDHDDHEDHAKHKDKHEHDKHHDDHHDDKKHDDHSEHHDDKHDKHHDDHEDHAKHEEKDHDDHDDHAKHDDDKRDDHDDHAGHDDHDHNPNAHLWLNPENAIEVVKSVEHTLSESDPKNAAAYSTNAAATIEKLQKLTLEIEQKTKGLEKKEFVVFHDAYKAFEHRFNLTEPLLITVNPETRPSAAKIRELQSEIKEHSISCIFIEPQFDGKLANLIAGNEAVKVATLDPLGAEPAPGAELYFQLLENMSTTLSECLK